MPVKGDSIKVEGTTPLNWGSRHIHLFDFGSLLNLENLAGYEVVTNERFDIDLRAIGVAVKHLRVEVAYSDFAFPKTIDPEIFATPSPPRGRS